MCVDQATLDALEFNKDKEIDYFLSSKSNGLNNSKLKPLYTAFLRLSEYKMGIKFDKDPLAVEQSNYLSKIATF